MSESSVTGTIMVVDDNPSNLRLLGKMLGEQGYRVRIFPKSKLAVKSAVKDPPDLILLDINMPEMNGYEVCQHLKADEKTKNLPVIFISALTETMDKIKAFGMGGVDYITKPFQIEEVQARISLHLTLKRAQNALETKNRELQKTLDHLRHTQKQLVRSEKMAALGILVAGIAHEINNPVNYIKASVLGLSRNLADLDDLLAAFERCSQACENKINSDRLHALKDAIDYPTLKTEMPQLVDNIEQGVRRTEEIVNSLRSYSRMDRIETEDADLCSLIDTALVILKNRYKKHISLIKRYTPLPRVKVHPGKVTQVLMNIISNAIDALEVKPNGTQGTITIKTGVQRHGDRRYAVITIDDNGPGIPEEIKGKIFDPFFTTKEVGGGTGLGLSISVGIIEEHQGMIRAESTKGNGTAFSIFLPII